MREGDLLHEETSWLNYTGQQLSLHNLTHVFKIDVNAWYNILSPNFRVSQAEQQKADRFVQPAGKRCSLVSKHFLRSLISSILKIPAGEIQYGFNPYGKPLLDPISFNLSHSGNLVVIALSEYPVGVDVEEIKSDFSYLDIMSSYFSTAEQHFIQEGQHPLLEFYILWTRKEAYLKGVGTGLTNDLHLVPSLQEFVPEAAPAFRLHSQKIGSEYVFSLASDPQTASGICYWEIRP